MSQLHQQMIVDAAALEAVVAEPLTTETIATMGALLGRLERRLAVAAAVASASSATAPA